MNLTSYFTYICLFLAANDLQRDNVNELYFHSQEELKDMNFMFFALSKFCYNKRR